MYESHFGLNSRPFGSKADGSAVFVGPGQVDIVNSLHKGLLVQDAVVTVSGPVGSGKTTVVNRGLETMSPGRMAAWVGRMTVSAEEILELLLAGFGFNRKTHSTLQRFAAFRRYMHERSAGGVPVAIVVEDARRLGAAVLAEIEALTAADTADGGGANIILMGDEGLNGLLADPELARLKQRIRCRLQVRPLAEVETAGYLRHAIRVAGGEFDAVFEKDVVKIVHACSEGMPRMINSLCESAMTAAMDAGDARVTALLVHEIAVNNFGFDGPAPSADIRQPAPEPTVDAGPAPATLPAAATTSQELQDSMSIPGIREEDIPESARNLVVESGRYPEEPSIVEDQGSKDEADATAEAHPDAIDTAEQAQDFSSPYDDEPTLTDIPELINDTQPQLDALTEAVGELLAAGSTEDPAAAVEPPAKSDGDAETFDLDAALSPDVESTNMMPGITQNLDEIAASKAADPAPAARAVPEIDDLPTLSDSMRVDVKNEVAKVGRVEANKPEDAAVPEPAIAEPQASAAAQTEADEASPEVDFGDALDSVLGDEAAAASPVNDDNSEARAPAGAQPECEKAPPEAAVGDTIDSVPEAEMDTDSPESADDSEAQAEGNEVPPEAAFGHTLDSLLEAEPQADSPEDANITAAAPDAKSESEAPVELSLEPSREEEPKFEPPLGQESEPELDSPLDEESALEPDPQLIPETGAQAKPTPEDPIAVEPVPEFTQEETPDDAPVMHDPAEHGADPVSDLDALEAALQAAKSGDFGPAPTSTAGTGTSNNEESEPAAHAPEITIDRVLAEQQAQTGKLDRFSAAMEGVNSLEEIDDLMAETLFGEEFAAIADSVVAEGQLVDPNADKSIESSAATDGAPIEASNDDAVRLDETPVVNGAPPRGDAPNGDGELRESVALRIDSLNEMKAKIANERTEVVELGEGNAHGPRANGPQPEPIERQINTSMTQTLQALKVAQTAEAVAEEKSKKKSGGLFARFRRSS